MDSSAIYAKSIHEHSVLMVPMALPSISSLSFITVSCGWHWHWYYFVYLLLAWQTTNIFWKFSWKAPVQLTWTSHRQSVFALTLCQSNITIAAYPTPFGRWLTAFCMVFNSETLLQKAYDSVRSRNSTVARRPLICLVQWKTFCHSHDRPLDCLRIGP